MTIDKCLMARVECQNIRLSSILKEGEFPRGNSSSARHPRDWRYSKIVMKACVDLASLSPGTSYFKRALVNLLYGPYHEGGLFVGGKPIGFNLNLDSRDLRYFDPELVGAGENEVYRLFRENHSAERRILFDIAWFRKLREGKFMREWGRAIEARYYQSS